jgi:hypothetical protein
MSDWFILRTSGRNTIPLAASLDMAGFEVWTPVIFERRRVPRKPDRVKIKVPLMPTFVFARASQIAGLLAESFNPTSPHADFSVFRYLGRIPLIADRDIEPLRAEERRISAPDTKRSFSPGDVVRMGQGGFAGMYGVVQQSNTRQTALCFGGRLTIKIDTWLLPESEAKSPQPVALVTGLAA